MSTQVEKSFSSFVSDEGGTKRFIRWCLIVILTWGLPAVILWAGLHMLTRDHLNRRSSLIYDQIDSSLDNFVYDSTPDSFFQAKFNNLFLQLKGLPANNEVLEKIIHDFVRQWPEGMLEIFLFNGENEIFQIGKATQEHEMLFRLANSSYDSGTISAEQLNHIGRVFPAPRMLLSRMREQRGKVIELGNPDRYSYCFFDNDSAVKNRFVAGVMIFIHQKHMRIDEILKKTISAEDSLNYGFVSENASALPRVIADFSAEEILAHYQQYPTSFFELKGHLIGLKRLDEYTLLTGAWPKPAYPYRLAALLFLVFFFASTAFLRFTFKITVLQKRFQHNVRHRLIGLFALCYALPLLAASFLVIQYLSELKHSMLLEAKHNNYRRLAEIDAGFTRFITARLLDFRNFSSRMQNEIEHPQKLIYLLQQKYESFLADSLHMVSSQSTVVYSNDLLTAEVRRHYLKPRQAQQKILESWKLRNASISQRHMKALFSSGKEDGRPEDPESSDGHDGFKKLLSSTGISAMEYYNNSNGISIPIVRTGSNLVVDTIIESNTQTLFQSARTNIGKFTSLQSLEESFLAFLDILPGPGGEAWYAMAILVDLVNFERQYFEKLYGDLKLRSGIMNRVFPEEDIRAVSTHQFAVNFPSVLEFKNFPSIIKRSTSDFKTFTQQMKISGTDSIVSVLRGSYLKHYLLLKVSPLHEIDQAFKARVNIIAIIFAVILVMGLTLARLLTRLLILPINDIMTGVKALAARNYQHRIPVRSENEFGILASAFNESAEILKRLTISERIRQQLYPEAEYRCGSYLISTANSNSRIILSDFFDYMPLKQGTYAIILAEISGNDISAAYLTAMLKTSFTLLCPSFPSNPETILEKLNQIFIPYNQKGHLTTCFIGIIDPTNDQLICANAGQSYPACISDKLNEKLFINLPSTPLGLNADTRYKSEKIKLDNRVIVLYSDGAVNLLNQEGEKLGHERFLDIVAEALKSDPRNPSEEILKRINQSAMNVPWRDDITVMTVQNRI